METLLVRLKPHDPRRGHVLRRYTYRGIKFHEERGWYRVEKPVADYLRAVRQTFLLSCCEPASHPAIPSLRVANCCPWFFAS